jgi:hypothetical protein
MGFVSRSTCTVYKIELPPWLLMLERAVSFNYVYACVKNYILYIVLLYTSIHTYMYVQYCTYICTYIHTYIHYIHDHDSWYIVYVT